MTTEPDTFGYEADLPGERTSQSLADLLDSDAKVAAEQIKTQFERIRQAEREAERAFAEVRLY